MFSPFPSTPSFAYPKLEIFPFHDSHKKACNLEGFFNHTLNFVLQAFGNSTLAMAACSFVIIVVVVTCLSTCQSKPTNSAEKDPAFFVRNLSIRKQGEERTTEASTPSTTIPAFPDADSLWKRLSTVEWISNTTVDVMQRQYTMLTKAFYQAITRSQGFWNTLPGYLQAVA